MEITGTITEWDAAEDTAAWRQFLETRTGRRLIPKVLESCPALLANGDVNSILIRSGEMRGFQMVLQALLSLSQPEPTLPANDSPSAYPPLDDDAAWKDGQKVKS